MEAMVRSLVFMAQRTPAAAVLAAGGAAGRAYYLVVTGKLTVDTGWGRRVRPLSPREREVLRLIARGHSNRQIARDLAIGEQTVKTHVRSILTKLALQDRVQAAIFALRHQADG